MRRTIEVVRTYKLSEYNSFKVGQTIIDVEDNESQELVDNIIHYINVSNDRAALQYTQLQSKLRPMSEKEALLFLAKSQEEALTNIQNILNKEV